MEGEDLCTADWAAWPAGAPVCVCRLHAAAVRSAALVSDEKCIRGVYTRRCAIQLYLLLLTVPVQCFLMALCIFVQAVYMWRDE